MENLFERTTIVNAAPVGALATSGGTAINTIQHYYTGFAPEMLHRPIETVLEQFRKGNKDVAKGQLKILRDMGGQDPKVLPALDVVSIFLNLLDVDETAKVRQQLTTFLAQQPVTETPSLLTDLCTSALLRVACREVDAEAARVVWNSLKSPGPHTKETFLALIATVDELEDVRSRGLLLTAGELRGAVEGAIRLGNYEIAGAAAKGLLEVDEGTTTRFLALSAKAGLAESEFKNKHFWSITASLHDDLMLMAKETSELLLLEPLPDSRLPQLAAKLFVYLRGGSEDLAEACRKKIDLIQAVHPECASLLRFQHQKDCSGFSEFGQKIVKAETDEAFRNQYINNLICESSLSMDDAIFLKHHAAPEVLKNWLGGGGRCIEKDELAKDLITLHLLIRSLDPIKDITGRRELRSHCQEFFTRHGQDLARLNADPILEIAGQLNALDLPLEAARFLEPLLPNGDYWPSPIFRCYLDSLVRAEKNATLAAVLVKIPDRFWNRWLWQLKARLEFFLANYAEAESSLQKGAAFGITPQLAVGLIDVMKKLGNESGIPGVLSQVPDTALALGDQYSQRLIVEMFKNGLEDRATSFVLECFIAGPDLSAVAITDIFNTLFYRDEPLRLGVFSGEAVVKGVRYSDGKSILTKLILAPEQARGQYFVSSSSPLGERLLKVTVGETFKEGIVSYKLEESLPAIVAAYQISLHIRDAMNEGTDCFHMFHAPENPHDLLQQLLEISSTNRNQRREILEHESLPLMFKGHMLRKGNPVDAALSVLSDSEAKRHPMPDYASEEDYQAVVIDVYGVIYLAITGLTTGLIAAKTEIIISAETEAYLKQWLSGRQRSEGGMLATFPNGKPLLYTMDHVRRRTEHIAEQIILLLDAAQITAPSLADLQPEMLDWRDCFDSSVLSIIRVAQTRNIPWLCIDFQMAKVADSLGCPVIKNCLHLLMKISDLTPFSSRKYGIYRHAIDKLPFPLRLLDFHDLSRDEEAGSAVVLSALLRQYPNAFDNTQHRLEMLVDLFLPVLANSWVRLGNFYNVNDVAFPSEVEKVANACFYIASRGGNSTAEINFAVFLHKMISSLTLLAPISKKDQ